MPISQNFNSLPPLQRQTAALFDDNNTRYQTQNTQRARNLEHINTSSQIPPLTLPIRSRQAPVVRAGSDHMQPSDRTIDLIPSLNISRLSPLASDSLSDQQWNNEVGSHFRDDPIDLTSPFFNERDRFSQLPLGEDPFHLLSLPDEKLILLKNKIAEYAVDVQHVRQEFPEYDLMDPISSDEIETQAVFIRSGKDSHNNFIVRVYDINTLNHMVDVSHDKFIDHINEPYTRNKITIECIVSHSELKNFSYIKDNMFIECISHLASET